VSQLINVRDATCPKCGTSDRTLCNRWKDNWTEIYCDLCQQHFASADYQPFTPTDSPRFDVQDVIARELVERIRDRSDNCKRPRPLRRIGTVLAGPNIESSFLVRKSLNEHIQDALAEMAFAKLSHSVWNGNPFRCCGPSGEDVYIHSIGASDPRQLVINNQYKDSNIIVLAVVDERTVWFLGWFSVSEARNKGTLAVNAQGENVYTVAAESLLPMDQLIGKLH